MKPLIIAILAVLSINAAYAKGGAHSFNMKVPHSHAKAEKAAKPHPLHIAGVPATHLSTANQARANDAMAKIDAIADGFMPDGK